MDNKEEIVEIKAKKLNKIIGIVSLVLSGVALLGSWIPLINVISMLLAVAGIIVGVVGIIMIRIKKEGTVILPIIAIILGILTFILAISVNNTVFNSNNSSSTSGSQSSSTNSAQNSNSSSSNSTQKSSSGSSSKQNENKEYKVGDVISWEGREITVTDVDKNYKPQYSTAKSGQEFIKLTVKIVNKSSSDISVRISNFEVQDSNGVREDYDASTFSLSDQFEEATLVSGGTRKGSIVFEVNKDDNNLILLYSPDSRFSNKILKIKL